MLAVAPPRLVPPLEDVLAPVDEVLAPVDEVLAPVDDWLFAEVVLPVDAPPCAVLLVVPPCAVLVVLPPVMVPVVLPPEIVPVVVLVDVSCGCCRISGLITTSDAFDADDVPLWLLVLKVSVAADGLAVSPMFCDVVEHEVAPGGHWVLVWAWAPPAPSISRLARHPEIALRPGRKNVVCI